MKILELCANYPGPTEKAALTFVKARNHTYRELGIGDITVLNFTLTEGFYVEDGFKVISLAEYKKNYSEENFDLLISHAPNIRNHYRFLMKYQSRFKKLVFVFHGGEVLSIRKEYPRPYPYLHKRNIYRKINLIYDPFKFWVWRHYFRRQTEDVTLVFVSEWIKNKFEEYIKLSLDTIKAHHYIINNNISKRFENLNYDTSSPKEYDFITIRSNLDNPKYAVDVVNNLAKANPQFNFLLIGKGEFFSHYEKARNIDQIESYLTPDEMVTLLNKSRCALMPTKNDTQGIMACEMATFGMPMITSDIEVCRSVFDGFANVAFISNEDTNIALQDIVLRIKPTKEKVKKYFFENTILREVELLKSICK